MIRACNASADHAAQADACSSVRRPKEFLRNCRFGGLPIDYTTGLA